MTQEFHLSVTPVGNDEYLVRTERVAPGVPLAEEQLVWPLESWLAQARQLMNDPLIGIFQDDRAFVPNPSSPNVLQPSLSLVELGQQLYHHLFQGTLRDSWLMAQGVAQNRRQALRLRLGLKGDRLPRLPWEVLYGSDTPIDRMRPGQTARPLATGIQVIFSRYRPATRLAEEGVALTIEPGQPLKILMVVASPSDREQLQLYREATQLQQELRMPSTVPLESEIQLTILSQPGREELTQALEQGQYQVLHYAGHSDVSAGGGSLYLVNSRTGLTELMSGEDLAGLLVNNGIRLAVFNSCRGAYTPSYVSSEAAGHNLSEALVGRGIPAVLAMAEQIPDEVALNLTRLFYRNLKQGYPIDLSLSRARQGLISSYGSDQLYWALPILYLHPEFDGYLIPPDRSQEDPADRLLFTPPTYEVLPLPPGEEAIFPPALLVDAELIEPDEADLIAQAVLAEDADWLDALEEAGATEDDDFAVADMIRQLIPPTPSDPASPPAVASPPITSVPASSSDRAPMPAALKDRPIFDSATAPSSAQPLPEEDTADPPTPAQTSAEADAQRSSSDEGAREPAFTGAMADRPDSAVAIPSRRDAARHRQQKLFLLPVLGAAGAIGLAVLGYFVTPRLAAWFDVSGSQTTPVQSPAAPQSELAAASTGDLQKLAIDSFSKNRFARGQQAVEALLDRGAFAEAEAALAAIPADRRNDAATHFLQGRLAWQGAKQGNSKYSVATARQSWAKAIAADPDNPRYHEAVGFADYEAGKPDQAIQSWVRALSLQEQPAAQEAANRPRENDRVLTSYAGIALGLWKTSTNPRTPQPGELLSKAVKTYQMVETMDAVSFQPDVLSQNWLWTPTAIRDWQSLSAATPEANGG